MYGGAAAYLNSHPWLDTSQSYLYYRKNYKDMRALSIPYFLPITINSKLSAWIGQERGRSKRKTEG